MNTINTNGGTLIMNITCYRENLQSKLEKELQSKVRRKKALLPPK